MAGRTEILGKVTAGKITRNLTPYPQPWFCRQRFFTQNSGFQTSVAILFLPPIRPPASEHPNCCILSRCELALEVQAFRLPIDIDTVSFESRSSYPFVTMGFVEDELKQLKEVIGNLDSRIKQLEKRTTGSSPSTEEIRMIIMGPPGAGK